MQNRAKMTQIKKRKIAKSNKSLEKRRVSVSEAKAHLSSMLKQVQDGQSIIVTDHGKDVARIEGIQEANQLGLILPKKSFSEVKNIRAPISDSLSARSFLELLREDRESR